ncbi:MAG: sugar transferase [Bacteroidetes bacterium]|nr:sugar transferase [Bacteroidota bacterium]
MTKRAFDILLSVIALIVLSPLLLIISMFVLFSSRGGILFMQTRVGKKGKDFTLLKFRTMEKDSDKKGLLTIGKSDNRITKPGRWLRKYKLDELPQLFNILTGNMSFVGPRPEVRKYVNLYSPDQMKVLSVKPGLTDYASLEYLNESEILNSFSDPEKAYINQIMPDKLVLNLRYIEEQGFLNDLKIMVRTVRQIIS